MNSRKTLILLKKILRIIIVILIVLIVLFKNYTYIYVSYNENNKTKVLNLLKNSKKDFNVEGTYTDHIFNNKITVLNIYEENYLNAIRFIRNNEELQKTFSNQINIINFIVKDTRNTDSISDLLSDKVENFVDKNNISTQTWYLDTIDDFKLNKIYIFDEKFDLVADLQDNVSTTVIKKTIINTSKKRKKLRKTDMDSVDAISLEGEEYFLGKFSDFLIVEKNGLYDFPIFIILDAAKKKLLFTGLDGKIVNIIELSEFCLPNKLRLKENTLYITDPCNGEIRRIDLKKGKNTEFDTLVRSGFLSGINDFDFVDEETIFIAGDIIGGSGFLNIKTNVFRALDEDVGIITDVEKRGKTLYFFDYSNNVLYLLGEDFKAQKALDLGIDILIGNMDKFLVVNEKNMYFLDSKNNFLYFYNGEVLEERVYDDFLYFPKNIIIYRNIYYILSDNFIQSIDFFNNTKQNILLDFSKYFSYHNLDKVIENEKIFLMEDNITETANNFNLQLVYNGTEYVENSPSFLNVFKIVDNNNLEFVKSFFLSTGDSILNFEGKNKESYLFYGKIFYKNESSEIKIKKVYKVVNFDEKNIKNDMAIIMF
ncbi:MAG: hypothetical protein LBG48_02975 [Rickettsiales bacterium]|nr:hypothetical protein [Rickettsiales bacterium]